MFGILRFSLTAIVLAAMSGFAFHATAASLNRAGDTLYLNSGIREPFTNDHKQGFMDQVVREAFSRIGKKAEVLVYNDSARALNNANNGIDDGATLRVRGLEKRFPNLVMVPEKVMDNDFVAYSLRKDIRIDGWESLQPYRVSYINGWQVFQNNLKDHKMITTATTQQEMFDLLLKNKVDVILFEKWQGQWRAMQLGVDFVLHAPPLASMEMFIYLNKKHHGIVNELAAAIRQMKDDGTYRELLEKTLVNMN